MEPVTAFLTSTSDLPLCFLFPQPQKQPAVSVLGVKRSNIITIALSSLPPPRLLPPAIYSMDNSVLDREDVQVNVTDNLRCTGKHQLLFYVQTGFLLFRGSILVPIRISTLDSFTKLSVTKNNNFRCLFNST